MLAGAGGLTARIVALSQWFSLGGSLPENTTTSHSPAQKSPANKVFLSQSQ
jgi:hypothetical protein